MGKRYLFAIRHLWQDVLADDGELQTCMDNVTSHWPVAAAAVIAGCCYYSCYGGCCCCGG